MRSIRSRKKQSGVVLIISLVMLVAMTVLFVGMMNMSTNQHVVIGNYQMKKEAEQAARQGLEEFLNTQSGFTNTLLSGNPLPLPYYGTPGSGGIYKSTSAINGYEVTVSAPYCYGARRAPGYSAISQIAPEDTNWTVSVTAKDIRTGAQAVIESGIKIRMGAGNCGDPMD